MCRVSGGFTGTREAWMKYSDPTVPHGQAKIKLFDTLEAAEAEAAKHNKAMNASPYRTASFSYRAQEYDGW